MAVQRRHEVGPEAVTSALEGWAASTRVGLAVKDAERRYRWTNAAYVVLHGAAGRGGAFVGWTDTELDLLPHPALRAFHEDRALASGQAVTLDEQVYVGGGGTRVLRLELVPLEEPGCILIAAQPGLAATASPLQPLSRNRAELDPSGPVGTFGYEARTGALTWSPEVYRLFAVSENVPVDLQFFMSFVHPDDLAHVQRAIDGALGHRKAFSLTFRIVRTDGAVRALCVSGAVTVDGEAVGIKGIAYDQTERLWLIRRNEVILDAVGDGVCGLDRAGRVTFTNPAADRMLRAERGGLVGRLLDEEVHRGRDGAPRGATTFVDALQSRRILHDRRDVFRRRDGTSFPVEYTLIPTTDAGHEGGVLSFRDTTEREEVEHRLRAGRDALASASEQRGRLLAELVDAHERERARIAAEIHDDAVQTLAAVGLRLERMEATSPGGALGSLRESVTEASDRLRRLIFELAAPELDAGLEQALAVYVARLEATSDVRYEIDARLAAEPADELRVLLYRMVQEALTNAAKHAQARHVRITLEDRDGGVRLAVTDDGIGAELEAFDRPRPGHFGVASLRHRAEVAGGHLRLDSAPGHGTTVEAWLPASSRTAAS
jgi:PAS domain S-box-containing protein